MTLEAIAERLAVALRENTKIAHNEGLGHFDDRAALVAYAEWRKERGEAFDAGTGDCWCDECIALHPEIDAMFRAWKNDPDARYSKALPRESWVTAYRNVLAVRNELTTDIVELGRRVYETVSGQTCWNMLPAEVQAAYIRAAEAVA